MTIDELKAPVLIATDDGTHAMPETIWIYELLNGQRVGERRFAGVVIAECSPRTESKYGRMRQLAHLASAQRRAMIAKLEEAERASGVK